MELKEKLLLNINKKQSLYEELYKVINSYGRTLETLNSQEEIDEYNQEHEKEDYQIITVPENNQISTPTKPKRRTKKIPLTQEEIKAKANDFYRRYYEYKDLQAQRLNDIEKYSGSGSSEYIELQNDMSYILKSWWNSELKKLQPEVKKYVRNRNKKINESKTILTEKEKKEFYQNLLEASFNPNVKSSWITQIWFEPNDDFEEDEEGNIIEPNPKDPNLKGTVFMKVKNSKTGKVYPTYEFYDVPRKVYIMWRRARSKGKYFWRRMKYNYEG